MALPLIAASTLGGSLLRGLSPDSTAPKTGGSTSPNDPNLMFQRMLTDIQQQAATLENLKKSSGAALQQQISAMSPEQQQELAQSLDGATVQVQDSNGQYVTGKVCKIRLDGGMPTVEVAGLSYKLDQIKSIQPLPTA